MKSTVHIVVNGRVQGVYFRANTQKQAIALGLTGYVRNMESVEVEIVCTGESSGIEALIQWCHKGPFLAKVLSVKVSQLAVDTGFIDFEIR